ncbi:hypothetical protein NBRC110019_12040 [Neptunitalea chrysea]|uniref:DUF4249 domain-containing protein n=1 Tax=Neptunitalea chrysea TaxID=1647581 RepID=A0A9W6B465_9FLAO|nr:DUF4249 family protein [Neptunitalea chrysea]GLB52165.1 hypothetical protein NBRC110019_12040 [Neptunitalea chrysea]
MLKKKFINRGILFLCAALMITACTEKYEVDLNDTYEDLLVVEAIITNENKQHEITLSKTAALGSDDSTEYVSTAEVYITSDSGDNYTFSYNAGSTKYISDIAFLPVADVNYTLHIDYNGDTFTSTDVQMAPVAEMTGLTIERKEVSGTDGIQISLSTNSPDSKLLRYTYEETFKIIAPKWSDKKASFYYEYHWPPADPTPSFEWTYREGESRTCYRTQYSENIILNQFDDTQQSDNINDMQIRFIPNDSYIMSYRYCIKTKQFVHNATAFSFYKGLKNTSSSNSTLSPIQPGFVKGNITNETNSSQKVIGIFDVATVTESERTFFNYEDYYPNEDLPPYYSDCDEIELDGTEFDRESGEIDGYVLLSYIEQGSHVLYKVEGDIYTMVPAACGDCTTLGSNVAPEFWVD